MPKAYSVFLLPCLLALGQLVLSFVTFADPKRRNIHRKPLLVVMVDHPGSFLLLNMRTHLVALGVRCDVPALILTLIGVLFIFIENYLPKLRQTTPSASSFHGRSRMKTTGLSTHRLGGKLFVACGLLTLVIAAISGLIGDTASFSYFPCADSDQRVCPEYLLLSALS
ncbi:MAG: hypothetical protein ACLTSZ_07300 [Lachnospiraceae bacterium]